jgi:RNA polymerase sigma factor (sigma-70 family)
MHGPEKEVADRDEVVRALGELPDRMRAVLVLRFFDDLSEAATAEALGCGVGTVKSQTSRGLARLRELLAEKNIVNGSR